MASLTSRRVDVWPVVVAVAVAAWSFASARDGSDGWRSSGERFYLSGVTLDGGAASAVVQGDLSVRSTDMPCANCHRRSGWAGSEGSVPVPPVAGPALFAPITRGTEKMGTLRTSGPGTRPAYDQATLLRALREGIDAAGRPLSATMPRYSLGPADAAALFAHLSSLSAEPAPGMTPSEVHLATIVVDGVDAAARAEFLDVLRAYVRDKNGGTRQEAQRRQRGPWDMKQHYELYRHWVLHEWVLTGSPTEWSAKLEALYRAQPVFAVIGGLSTHDWTPIHEFAERARVPVLLPQAPLSPDVPAQGGFYTLYYSRGVAVEADTLVDRLQATPPAAVVQVARCGTAGHAAMRRVAGRLAATTRVVGECADGSPADSLRVTASLPAAVTVLWLDAVDLRRLVAGGFDPPGTVYLSSTLLVGESEKPLPAIGADVRLLHPFVPPDELEQHAWRALTWLRARGLATRSRQIAVNALIPAMLASDALTHPRVIDSREYFIEQIEGMASRSPSRSAYPELSFGVQRRVGAAGCYVLQVPTAPDTTFRKVGAWIVPRS